MKKEDEEPDLCMMIMPWMRRVPKSAAPHFITTAPLFRTTDHSLMSLIRHVCSIIGHAKSGTKQMVGKERKGKGESM